MAGHRMKRNQGAVASSSESWPVMLSPAKPHWLIWGYIFSPCPYQPDGKARSYEFCKHGFELNFLCVHMQVLHELMMMEMV